MTNIKNIKFYVVLIVFFMVSDHLYEKTLVTFTIEDAEIFELLKRQCLNGTFSVFLHLVGSRVKSKKKNHIFKQCDEKGCILLHYAAQGGSLLIVDEIFENVSDDILEYKCIRGETALHFAIKYKQKDMAQHLISKHSKRITRLQLGAESTAGKRQGSTRNLKDDNIQNEGEFAPVHWAAWYGDKHLLHSLKEAYFNISTITTSGLNILDIACMSEELKGNIEFCRHLLDNESEKIFPTKTDLSGWNIAHYASMSNKNLFEFIAKNENKKIRCLILETTNSKKTCLHIACEFGKFEIVTFIVINFRQLINCLDDFGRNALHFAAKGGNLMILKYLNENGLDLKSLTFDKRTILHIACIHKNVDICQYIVDHFSKELLNARTNERGLTAAHYLGAESKGDGSELKILEIFCNSEMDLTVLSKRGLSVLDRAIDQLNVELIQAMVSQQYRKKCGINIDVLLIKQNNTDNDAINEALQMAIIDLQK